jgi:hypothetical protein
MKTIVTSFECNIVIIITIIIVVVVFIIYLENLDVDVRIILQEILGRTNRLLSLIGHRPHKNDALSSNNRGNFTEPLPSNYRHLGC